MGPLQQAIEELIQKTQSQKADHKAALKKERKKRKQLRKNLESQWWAGGGHIPGWLVSFGGKPVSVSTMPESSSVTPAGGSSVQPAPRASAHAASHQFLFRTIGQ